jgi:putative flippase GtrA
MAGDPQRLKLARFLGTSAIATSTTIVVLALLIGGAGLGDVPATLAATSIGSIPAFELCRRWVWSDSRDGFPVHQAVTFWALGVVRLGFALAAVRLVSRFVDHWGAGDRTLAIEITNLSAYAVLWLGQFVLLDQVLFRVRSRAVAP